MVQTRKQRRVIEAETRSHDLIPGLPNDVALLCLGRVPPLMQGSLAGVRRSWRKAVVEGKISQSRVEQGLEKEEWLLVFVRTDVYKDSGVVVLAYNPLTQAWAKGKRWDFTGARCLDRRLDIPATFGTSTGEKVYFPGGPVLQESEYARGRQTTCEVWSFEPVLQNWSQEPPMLAPHWAPACGVVDGKIIVVGNNWRSPGEQGSTSTECFDIQTKQWSSIPDAPFKTSRGAITGGRFWVLSREDPDGPYEHLLWAWDHANRQWIRHQAPDCLPPCELGDVNSVTSNGITFYVCFSDAPEPGPSESETPRLVSFDVEKSLRGDVHTLHKSATMVPYFGAFQPPLLTSSSTTKHIFVLNIHFKVKDGKVIVTSPKMLAIEDVGSSDMTYPRRPIRHMRCLLPEGFPAPTIFACHSVLL